ncbi:unnamed protein product [Amaranthus hypochondriacus]
MIFSTSPTLGYAILGNATSLQIRRNWDKDEVYKFLASYYGKTLSCAYWCSRAALAIGNASCAFGALVCYWRSQQKTRQYRHLHLHSPFLSIP